MTFEVQFTDVKDIILDETEMEADDLYECMRKVIEGYKWPDGTASISVSFVR